MSHAEIVVRVRFSSDMPLEEVMAVAEARGPEFEALAGLKQKYYLQEVASGDYSGLYVWESAEAFEAFRDSELRASIARAYRAKGEPEIEVYRVFKILREGDR